MSNKKSMYLTMRFSKGRDMLPRIKPTFRVGSKLGAVCALYGEWTFDIYAVKLVWNPDGEILNYHECFDLSEKYKIEFEHRLVRHHDHFL